MQNIDWKTDFSKPFCNRIFLITIGCEHSKYCKNHTICKEIGIPGTKQTAVTVVDTISPVNEIYSRYDCCKCAYKAPFLQHFNHNILRENIISKQESNCINSKPVRFNYRRVQELTGTPQQEKHHNQPYIY